MSFGKHAMWYCKKSINGLLSSLRIKTLLSKIPLVCPLLF